jgi:AcrR family transcriptional regulator
VAPAIPAGTRRKRSYHHGDLRPALLQVSRALVEDRGVGAVTFREVARRVGVSHAAPTHHFSDKTELLANVAAQGFEELTAAMQAAVRESGADAGASARLNATGIAYIGFAARHPNLFRLMFGRELAPCDVPCLVEASGRAYAVLECASREVLTSRGAVDVAELEVLIASAWSLVHGMSMLWLDGRLMPSASGPDALVELARRVTDLLALAVQPMRS